MRTYFVFALIAACSRPDPSPTSRREAKARGMAAYDHKDFATCATLLDQAEDWYDAACCRAQLPDPKATFAELQHAVDTGFRDLEHLKIDSDLVLLHADPHWAAFVASFAAKLAADRASLDAELLQLYTDDQADRAHPPDEIDWQQVGPRDLIRHDRVEAILAAGGAKASDDYFHAAMILQHGATTKDSQHAHDLAVKAVALDPHNGEAKWLIAAAEDRALMFAGKPQKYGTQFHKVDGAWAIYDFDPAVTDDDRDAAGVPSLAEQRARADAMNAAK